VAAVLLVLTGLLAGIGFALSTRSDAAPARESSTAARASQAHSGAPTTPQTRTSPARASPTVDDLVRRTDAPSASPEDLLQGLSDRRADALVARAVAGLALVDAEASPALSADAALVAGLTTSGQRWEGLRLEVAQAAVVTASSTRAVLRARVDWTAYRLVTGAGPLARPAATGEVLDFTLTRGARGWRIASISPPAT
jgi:hypothetical protein